MCSSLGPINETQKLVSVTIYERKTEDQISDIIVLFIRLNHPFGPAKMQAQICVKSVRVILKKQII